MSRANAAFSLPPSDRDDAPEPELRLENAPTQVEIEHIIDQDRTSRLGRMLTEATKDLLEFQSARARKDRVGMDTAVKRLAANASQAGPLARLIERAASAARSRVQTRS